MNWLDFEVKRSQRHQKWSKITLWTRYLKVRLWEFHQIYTLGTKIRFCGRKVTARQYQISTLVGILSSIPGMHGQLDYFRETCDSYSVGLPGSRDTGDIFQVMDSKVKVTDNIFRKWNSCGGTPIHGLPLMTNSFFCLSSCFFINKLWTTVLCGRLRFCLLSSTFYVACLSSLRFAFLQIPFDITHPLATYGLS